METWKNFTIEEIFTTISDKLGSARLGAFLVEMIELFNIPEESDLSDLANTFAPTRLMEEIELYFSYEDLKIVENSLNGIIEVPYHVWVDVRNPNYYKQVLKSLNKYEMVAYVSRTRSKWSAGLCKDGKLFDFSGPQKGTEITPKYIMRLNVEGFNRETDDAVYKIKSLFK